MPPEPEDTQSPDPPDTPATPPALDPAHYSHEGEIRALRRALARLETLVEQEEDPAALVRLAASIARLSDSIVRATAAHHKLVEQYQEGKLAQESARLERAWRELYNEKEQYREKFVEAYHDQQRTWLLILARSAHAAAEGDASDAKEVAEGLDAFIQAGQFHQWPEPRVLARLRDEALAANYYASQVGSGASP